MTPERATRNRRRWRIAAWTALAAAITLFFTVDTVSPGLEAICISLFCNVNGAWYAGWLDRDKELASTPKPARCTCTTFSPSGVTVNGARTCRYCGLLP